MSNGNAGLVTKPILRENKVTLYKLHPSDFGRVIKMPNLPNGLHEAELWRNKGYKKTPQELMPDAQLEQDPEGGIFLVPDGYTLKPVTEKTEFERKQIDVTNYHVIKDKEEPTPTASEPPLYVSDKPKSRKKNNAVGGIK